MDGPTQTPPYPLRMPDGMRKELESIAQKNGRSLNAEITKRLQDTLDISEEFLKVDWDDPKEFALLGVKALLENTANLQQVLVAMEQQLKAK